MTYSVLRMIDQMPEQFPLLLNSILNRIPIIVSGRDSELIDDLVESLTLLAPHRHKLVFWRDFTSEEEIMSVSEEERHDYEVSRTIACSLSPNLKLALERIRKFDCWIIGVPLGVGALGYSLNVETDDLEEVRARILRKSMACGILNIESPSNFNFELVGNFTGSLETEKRIVDKILTRQKQSLERIRRLLSKSLRGMDIPDGLMTAVLKLDDESEKLTQDMFEEEINNFVYAARRAVTLLSRIRLARELGASTVLTERNLFEAIGWDNGDLMCLIRFIQAEWHEDFSDCVKLGTLSGLGAWVDSMWGS